jgi:hypothetical protein
MNKMKIDLIDSLTRDRYYEEIELTRLLNDEGLFSHKFKIEEIKKCLRELVMIDSSISLINQIYSNPIENNEELNDKNDGDNK